MRLKMPKKDKSLSTNQKIDCLWFQDIYHIQEKMRMLVAQMLCYTHK